MGSKECSIRVIEHKSMSHDMHVGKAKRRTPYGMRRFRQ